MVAKSEDIDALQQAAIAFLHQEIQRHGEVRLTSETFEAGEAARLDGQAIQLGYDERSGDIILTHAKRDISTPVS